MTTHFLNPRVRHLPSSKLMAFTVMASQSPGVVSLLIGQPDFPTSTHVKEAAQRAIAENWTTYSPPYGYPSLLESACHYVDSRYGQRYKPDTEVLITNGATQGLYTALSTILQEGDEVILPAPIYPGYEPVIAMCGATPVYVDTSQSRFKLTADQLRSAITSKTRCVILNYPANPTGVTLTKQDVLEIRDVLVDRQIFVVSDEVYSEFVYETAHVSIANAPGMWDKTIVVNSLSKSHAMTGWRVGMVFAPKDIMDHMKKVHECSVLSISSVSQIAAARALREGIDDPQAMRAEYYARRDYVVKRLKEMNLEVVSPSGAFYVFPSISKYQKTSTEFSTDLLRTANVAVLPGDCFSVYGEGYIRLSFATSMESLGVGLDRLESYLYTQSVF